MRAGQILESKGTSVATVAPSATIAEATRTLQEWNCGALVVSEDGKQVSGIISERDIVRCLADAGAGALDQAVSALMKSDVVTCSRGDDTEHLMDLMTERRIRHVPVVEDDQLIGIISIGDVVKVRVGELQNEREQLVGYIREGR